MSINAEIINAVVSQVKGFSLDPLVVDPVMVSRTGDQLIDNQAITSLREGLDIHTLDDMRRAARRIHELGAKAVLVKGGAMTGDLCGIDVWFDGFECNSLKTTLIETKNNHGTGCTLSSAIAANLAMGHNLLTAVQNAKEYVTTALQYALDIGQGYGCVGHFFPVLPSR